MRSSLVSLAVLTALLAPVAASATVTPYNDASGIPIPFGVRSSSSASSVATVSRSSSSSSLPARSRRVALRQILGYEKGFADKTLTQTQRDVIADTNRERRQYGLPNLREDRGLTAFAQAYAKDMSERGYFSHDMPEGISFQERLQASAYFQSLSACQGCRIKLSAGENIATGQTTPEEAVKDWIASAEHKANILNPTFTKIGVGRMDRYWVQIFVGLEESRLSSTGTR